MPLANGESSRDRVKTYSLLGLYAHLKSLRRVCKSRILRAARKIALSPILVRVSIRLALGRAILCEMGNLGWRIRLLREQMRGRSCLNISKASEIVIPRELHHSQCKKTYSCICDIRGLLAKYPRASPLDLQIYLHGLHLGWVYGSHTYGTESRDVFAQMETSGGHYTRAMPSKL